MIDRRTGISVDRRIKDRLDDYKLTPSETYENTIIRLIEKHKGDKNGGIFEDTSTSKQSE